MNESVCFPASASSSMKRNVVQIYHPKFGYSAMFSNFPLLFSETQLTRGYIIGYIVIGGYKLKITNFRQKKI